MNNKVGVELGVLEECESYLLESRYFPNKLGGKPAWLDLKNLPSDFSCGVCSKVCIFLCQVYAPIDDNPNCHHRTIFIFICPESSCCKNNENKNIIVFRSQLPAVNDFYPVEDPTEEIDWHPEGTVENFSRVCSLCGNPAPFNCGKCKVTSYCSKEHQVAHWKLYGHKVNCGCDGVESQIEVPFLFPEFEITIDKPPEQELLYKSDEACMEEYNELVSKDCAGTLDDVSPTSLEQYTSVKNDKYFSKYKRLIDDCPEQVLRYDRGGDPLFITKPHFQQADIPVCEYCNGTRQFEFQILSTLLNELACDDMNGLDWGTLLVYTCKNNCHEGPAYKREFVIKQDIV